MADNETGPAPPEASDRIKEILWVAHHLRQNAELLVKPAVLIALVLALAAGYFYGSSRTDDAITVKNERIAFLTDQINAYKDRLQGASPDEAAKRIADLENRLKPLLDRMGGDIVRHLSDDQKAKIIQSAKPYEPQLSDFYVMVSSTADRDSDNYCQELYHAFKDSGLHAMWGGSGNLQEKGEYGVMVQLLGDTAHPSDGAKAVMDILSKAGIQYATEADPNDYPPNDLGVEILITKERAQSAAQ